MSNETLGFCVEYKAGKTSRAQYLTSDQKTVSPTGFVWSSEQAAKNAMGSFQAFVNRRHQPCASLKIVSPKVMQANAKKLVADAVKKAGEVESATKKENKGPTFPQTDDAKVSAEEHVEDAKPAEGPAQPIAISAENSSAVFHRLVDVTRAWSDMMAHADDDRALFARQMADEDLRMQDMLHLVELSDLTDAESVALVKQMKESRIRRREAKDAIAILDALSSATFQAQAVHLVIQNFDTRHYAPRIDAHLQEKLANETAQANSTDQKDAGEAKTATEEITEAPVTAPQETNMAQPVTKPSQEVCEAKAQTAEEKRTGGKEGTQAEKTAIGVETEKAAEGRGGAETTEEIRKVGDTYTGRKTADAKSEEIIAGSDGGAEKSMTECHPVSKRQQKAAERALNVYDDHIDGLTYKQLAGKYHVSEATIAHDIAVAKQWREAYQ